jgi:hypothetical protein
LFVFGGVFLAERVAQWASVRRRRSSSALVVGRLLVLFLET